MDGRVAIITGASSGIGAALASEAATRGIKVVLAARRTERIEALAEEITARGGEALALTVDVSRLEDQRRLVDKATQHFGRIDILVNNAGKPLATYFHQSPPEALQDQWDVNVTAIATLTRLALPQLMQSKGIVVNIGSSVSRFPVPMWGNYAPTKVAVAALSDALRRELGALGVRVCLVEPGPIDTEFGTHVGWPGDFAFISSAEGAARAIAKLFDRPRRRLVYPPLMAPFLSLGGALVALLPSLVDAAYVGMFRLRGFGSGAAVQLPMEHKEREATG